MAQYKIKDPDELVQCPYDKAHMIRASRMPYHLMKCKKNFPDKKLRICPYNACHYVPKDELQKHIETCEDSARIEIDIIHEQHGQDDSYIHGDCSVPVYNREVAHVSDGEDWDAECDTSRGEFVWGKMTADEYFSGITETRRGVDQVRRPNSTSKYIPVGQNNRERQPLGRGFGVGRGQTRVVGATLPGLATSSDESLVNSKQAFRQNTVRSEGAGQHSDPVESLQRTGPLPGRGRGIGRAGLQ